MEPELKKNLVVSLVLHVVVLVGFFLAAAFMPRPEPEIITMMEIMGGGGGGEPDAGPAPTPAPPEPPKVEPQPIRQEEPPEPPKPAEIEKPKPADIVVPKEPPKKKVVEKPKAETKEPPKKVEPPKPPPKPTVQKGKLITRSQFSKSSTPTKQYAKNDPRYSASSIRSRLGKAVDSVKVGTYGGGPGTGEGPGGVGSQYGDYYSMLAGLLYEAWDIPGTASPSLTTIVVVNVTNTGTLTFVKILRSSGNAIMDESCVAACRAVRKVDPLPAGLGSSRDLTITFKPVGL